MNVNISISFDQLLNLIKQLPVPDKIKLARELDKETIPERFSILLKGLKTNELTLDEITKEVEEVRSKRYASR